MRDKIEQELKSATISIVNLFNYLVEDAYLLHASDIHLNPAETEIIVRFRIDGILQDFYTLPKQTQEALISRIKILSGLRTDEHQSAQDGRFRISVQTHPVDIRVSIMPTYYGENAVLRLLTDAAAEFTLESLGMSKNDSEKILRAIKKPFGMILATGPTGSGKTTTLYTIIKILNRRDVSIITIEDPIEYAIAGIDQIGVNVRTGLNFANGLRSILRQDPNIIMVGEIRDTDTAGLAVNTALTGHLLLSSLHTNDAATTLPRLLDMRIEPYLIASTVNIAVGQRLLRKICPSCKTERKITVRELKSLKKVLPIPNVNKLYQGQGCHDCNHTGFKGRIGVYEVLEVTENIREAILNKAQATTLRRLAIREGMTPLVTDALKKAIAGITTIEEVLSILHE